MDELGSEPEDHGLDERRRDALKKIGLFGAYTAPVMLAMLKSSKALAASPGGGCCWSEARLPSGGKVGEARVGDALLMMRPDRSAIYEGAVEHTRPGVQPCLRFETDSAIGLTCSYSTRMAVRRADVVVYIGARDCLEGDLLPVLDDGGFRWEAVTQVEEAGELPVALITAKTACTPRATRQVE